MNHLTTGKNSKEVKCEQSLVYRVDLLRNGATPATLVTKSVFLPVSVPRNLCNLCNHTCLSTCLRTSQPLQPVPPYLSVYMSLHPTTFATLATIPVCLYVSVPPNLCNLSNPSNHTSLSICLYTSQPLQPQLSVYLSMYLAIFATLATIPVSVPCNLCNPCNHTYLSICLCTSQPLQPLQPFQSYLSVYMSLYLSTFATTTVCLSVYVPRNFCNP